MLTRASQKVTLGDVMAVPGVGAQVMASLSILDRVRLRQTCRAFRDAADESLRLLTEIWGEDILVGGERKPPKRALAWLMAKCPDLHTLSVAPRASLEMPWLERARVAIADRWQWQSEHRNDDRNNPAVGETDLVGQAASSLWEAARVCQRLEHLNVAGCWDVGDDDVAAVARRCPNLKALDVSGCNVKTTSITAVAESCRGLTRLALYYCGCVTDEGLRALARHCQGLEELDLAGNPFVSAQGVFTLAATCRRLRRLSLPDRVTSDSVRELATRCPDLEQLGLRGCAFLSDGALQRIGRSCPGLTRLDLSRCQRVTDDGVFALLDRCAGLVHLQLAGTGICDGSLLEIGNNCPELEYLDVSGCVVTDEGVECVARGCPRLRHLSLTGDGVTDASVRQLASRCRRLRKLVLQDTAISAASISAIGASCRDLRHLDVSKGRFSLYPRYCDKYVLSKNGPSLVAVAEGCVQLEYLDVTSSHAVTKEAMAAISNNCAKLRVFLVGDNYLKDGDVSKLIKQRGHQLRELDLSKNAITDKTLALVARKCTRLCHLSVRDCKVTDKGASFLRLAGFEWFEDTQSAMRTWSSNMAQRAV